MSAFQELRRSENLADTAENDRELISGDTIKVIYDGSDIRYVVAVGYEWCVVPVNVKYARITFSARSKHTSILVDEDDYDVVWDGAAALSRISRRRRH